MSLLNEEKGQAKGILLMILTPVAFLMFLIMLQMLDPVFTLLFPQIDNMATSGNIYGAAILKIFLAFVPTIIATVWLYSSIIDVGK